MAVRPAFLSDHEHRRRRKLGRRAGGGPKYLASAYGNRLCKGLPIIAHARPDQGRSACKKIGSGESNQTGFRPEPTLKFLRYGRSAAELPASAVLQTTQLLEFIPFVLKFA